MKMNNILSTAFNAAAGAVIGLVVVDVAAALFFTVFGGPLAIIPTAHFLAGFGLGTGGAVGAVWNRLSENTTSAAA